MTMSHARCKPAMSNEAWSSFEQSAALLTHFLYIFMKDDYTAQADHYKTVLQDCC